jgi:hypothetical protein
LGGTDGSEGIIRAYAYVKNDRSVIAAKSKGSPTFGPGSFVLAVL